ncbi:T9SS type B sorting domain-containing protein [Polaribacter sp. R77954]|uniref:T9SS type B sorting domain-containing protein n=1 Tax=Polaribacter sp. R77954 TaxID=3093870 RepID=UPI0037C91446
MNKSVKLKIKLFSFLFFIITSISYSQVDKPPTITADGRQAFCIGSPINIVTDFTIDDPDDNSIASFFIQISSGYQVGFDSLELTGNYPFIKTTWNASEGKLTLTSVFNGGEIPLDNLKNAVMDIVFTANTLDVTTEKFFSLSITDANYLPKTDHFYEFVEQQNITWSSARTAAENRTYFGRKGYLATLTSQEEADFAGKQASGAGWIGASDEENEGEWKWMTGPEAGITFWRGNTNNTTNGFSNWNVGEPNNEEGNEHYAHVTDPSVGSIGSWNDLPNVGGTDSRYVPKGYIVAYGTLTDPPLSIVASTSIYIPQIISTINATVCESGSATITAIPSEGEILWHDNPNIGTQPALARGNNFTVNNITETTSFYANITVNGCITSPRIEVIVNIIEKPKITNTINDLICSGTAVLTAEASSGTVYWYETATSTTPIFIGDNYRTPNLTETTIYFVEANNTSCAPSARTQVVAEVNNTTPQFDILKDTFILCADIGNVDLKTINAQGNYRYIWKREGALLTESTATVNTNTSGNYTVSAVSEVGYQSDEKDITVIISEKTNINIKDIKITDDSENNSIQIDNQNLGNGNYEFAIDDEFGNYQNEPFLDNLSTGIHTLYIKDSGGCGIENITFSILSYPKYFTPGNNGNNDIWSINGFDQTFYTSSNISIYNRFGKLIYKIDKNSKSWDGTYQGKNFPSNSYWFKASLTDINGLSIEKTGNFSLIRK